MTRLPDDLRRALADAGYKPGVIFRARSGREVWKYTAPNGAPVLIELLHHDGGIDVYGVLSESSRFDKAIAALRLYALRV